jgi:glycosyltransferase involved in cell wall biosynthesis
MIAYTRYVADGRVRLGAQTLTSWGNSVVVLTPKHGEKAQVFDVQGVTVMELNTYKHRGKSNLGYVFAYLMFTLLAFFSCTKLFFKRKLRAVHVHNIPDFLVFAAIVPRLFGRRLILDIHDSVPETYMAKFESSSRLLFNLLRFEEWVCCLVAHYVLCVNEMQRQALVERGINPRKVKTILSVHSLAPVSASAERQPRPGVFRMVWHGTVSARLGIDLIVHAAAKLATRIPGFQFHVYGHGEELPAIKELAKSLGAGEQIHFHGEVPWDTLPRELAGMDVGIVGNRRNIATDLMLPVKLIDFIALNIPAVVPRLRTLQHYCSDETVTFFEPGDVDSMADAVMAVYRDAEGSRKKVERAKTFLEQYRWDRQSGFREVYAMA